MLEKNRYAKHPIGRSTSLMEMYQMMPKYQKVYKNVVFENIHTMPLELPAGIEITI